jgi:hypothetical protein
VGAHPSDGAIGQPRRCDVAGFFLDGRVGGSSKAAMMTWLTTKIAHRSTGAMT